MLTKSYISAAALAAALLATPNLGFAQGLGVNLDLGGLGVDANVGIGGQNLLDVDAGVNLGGSDGLNVDAGVAVGGSGSGDSLVDVDLDATSGAIARPGAVTGPNGGSLISLGSGGTGTAVLDADIDLLGNSGSGGSRLITGDVRIGALGRGDDRTGALLGLIDSPNLADIDLDAAIDDRRVSILAAADLLGPDDLLDVRAAIQAGGSGRTELLDALSASVELGAILDRQGIDPSDVLAIQIAENGATEVIVLGDAVQVALLGGNGNLADLTVDELADLDLDLLSSDELAELNLDLLPDHLASAVRLRLLADDGNLADLSIGDLVSIDVNLLPGADDGGTGGSGGGGTGGGTGGNGGGTGGNGGGTGGNGNTGGDGNGSGGNTGGGGSSGGSGSGGNTGGSGGSNTGNTGGAGTTPDTGTTGAVIGTLPPTQVAAGFRIAALGCDIGVLALANGMSATPQAISGAQTLELVRIEGCERSLVDRQVDTLRAAIAGNPAISSVLEQATIPLDQVIGATIQGGTLTLFIEPVLI